MNLVRQILPNANATLYTATGGANVRIESFLLCNTSALPRTVRVHFVAAGGAAALGNSVLYDAAIRANTTVRVPVGQSIALGETIQGQASAADAVAIHVEGEVTAR